MRAVTRHIHHTAPNTPAAFGGGVDSPTEPNTPFALPTRIAGLLSVNGTNVVLVGGLI